jgi:hypothetical protein
MANETQNFQEQSTRKPSTGEQGNDMRQEDEIDRVLDAALAKYAGAEPRAGLENRILANLTLERSQVPDHTWWRWGAVAAAAAVVVVAVTIAWRPGRPPHPIVENHPSVVAPTLIAPALKQEPKVSLSNGTTVLMHSRRDRRLRNPAVRRATLHGSQPEAVVAANPKLDRFPSPRPLSEQENILANFVTRFPEHAALIARARTEALRRDRIEEMQNTPSNGDQDSQRQDGNE